MAKHNVTAGLKCPPEVEAQVMMANAIPMANAQPMVKMEPNADVPIGLAPLIVNEATADIPGKLPKLSGRRGSAPANKRTHRKTLQ